MKKYKVGIIGATGMVGQRFVLLTAKHPWFEPVVLAASAHSAGKAYKDAVAGKWFMQEDIPESEGNLVVMDAEADAEKIASMCRLCLLRGQYEKRRDQARWRKNTRSSSAPSSPTTPPTAGHRTFRWSFRRSTQTTSQIIDAQRKRLGTKRGFIAVKSNCSLQSYVPALHPLMKYGVEKVLVCTYQAISGAGKTFETWPEMIDNVIPYIGGEEEKSEQEPLKLWGKVAGDHIENASSPAITAQCLRVPCSDGHMAACIRLFQGRKAVYRARSRPTGQHSPAERRS